MEGVVKERVQVPSGAAASSKPGFPTGGGPPLHGLPAPEAVDEAEGPGGFKLHGEAGGHLPGVAAGDALGDAQPPPLQGLPGLLPGIPEREVVRSEVEIRGPAPGLVEDRDEPGPLLRQAAREDGGPGPVLPEVDGDLLLEAAGEEGHRQSEEGPEEPGGNPEDSHGPILPIGPGGARGLARRSPPASPGGGPGEPESTPRSA